MKRFRSRLVVSIYVVGLVQFIVAFAGTTLWLRLKSPPPFAYARTMSFVVETIAEKGDDRPAVTNILARLRSQLGCSLALYDENDRLVTSDPLSAAPSLRTSFRSVPDDMTFPVAMAGGRTWRLIFLSPPEAPTSLLWRATVLILVVVSVGSLLLARALAHPLARLTATARAFGAGDLGARVRMERTDELGELAVAFDHMADRVARALRAEKELLANVSHELRTPLQRIHIAVDLAAEGDSATARESLQDIAQDLAELERIVEDVLTAARLSLRDGQGLVGGTSSLPIRPETLDVRGLLDRSATRFRLAHQARPLRVAVDDQLPRLGADGVLLRRVVDNLLDNADKYSDDPTSEIVLTAKRSEAALVIEVTDHGVGITPEDLEQVFEPFFRADRSRTRTTGGLGLGLALARRIVEAHGGQLTMTSTVNVGSVVRVELPIDEPQAV